MELLNIEFIERNKTTYDDASIYNVYLKYKNDVYKIFFYKYQGYNESPYYDAVKQGNKFYTIHGDIFKKFNDKYKLKRIETIDIDKIALTTAIIKNFRFYLINN